MKLREIMTTDYCCASPSDTLSKVASEMKRHNVGAMPVCQNGSIVGMITDRDIVIECVAAGRDPNECKVSSFMTKELVEANPDMNVEDAARLMGSEQVHRLPVVEGGRLVGIISLGDLAVQSKDDKLVADLLRQISLPVRSAKPQTIAA